MKKRLPYLIRIALIFVFAVQCFNGFSQDTLQLMNLGDRIEVDNALSLTTCTKRSERNELYRALMDSVRLTMTRQELKNHKLYLKGKADAKNGYKARGGIFVGITWYGVPFYLWSKPWRLNILNTPHRDLLTNPLYYAGYMKGVQRKKAGKLLLGLALTAPLGIIYLKIAFLIKDKS